MNSIIGTWRLSSLELRSVSGDRQFPFGKHVRGLLLYQDDGFMSGIISGENRPAVSSHALLGIAETERSSIAKNFISYAGTYRVENDMIIHNIETSFIPNLMSKREHISTFSINDDTLVITSGQYPLSEQEIYAVLVWKSVRTQ